MLQHRAAFTGVRIIELPPQTLIDGGVRMSRTCLDALGLSVVSAMPGP